MFYKIGIYNPLFNILRYIGFFVLITTGVSSEFIGVGTLINNKFGKVLNEIGVKIITPFNYIKYVLDKFMHNAKMESFYNNSLAIILITEIVFFFLFFVFVNRFSLNIIWINLRNSFGGKITIYLFVYSFSVCQLLLQYVVMRIFINFKNKKAENKEVFSNVWEEYELVFIILSWVLTIIINPITPKDGFWQNVGQSLLVITAAITTFIKIKNEYKKRKKEIEERK